MPFLKLMQCAYIHDMTKLDKATPVLADALCSSSAEQS